MIEQNIQIYKVNPEGQPGKSRVLHFLAAETQERLRGECMFILDRIMREIVNLTIMSDSRDEEEEEEEDLPGLLPNDLYTLPLPSSTTGPGDRTVRVH